MIDLTKDNPYKVLIKYSYPMLIGNLFQLFHNVIDSIMVSRLLGKECLAAVGICSQITTTLITLSIGITFGTSILISKRIGEKNEEEINKVIDTGFVFSTIIAVFVSVFCTIFTINILIVFKVPEDIFVFTNTYITIIFIGFTPTFLYNTMANILRGLGDSKTPTFFLLISCFINIILNLLFIKYLKLGIGGAAWATVIAQTFAFMGVFIYSSIKYPNYRIHLFHPLFKIYALKSILKYSIPSTMQEIFRSIGLMSLQIIINGFGTGCIAAYTVVSRVDSFAQLPTINLGRALANYTAQNLGAKKEDRIKKGFKAAFVIGLTVIMTISIFILLSPDFFIKIFSRDNEVILIGRTYLRIVGMVYSVSLLMHLLNGVLLGYEKTFIPMLATIISLCIIQVPSALLLSSTRLGYIGIWIATPLGWIGGVLIRYYYYRKIVIMKK